MGIVNETARITLATQMVASIRRFEYTEIVCRRNIAPERLDPCNRMFDPERAAVVFAREGNFDEAIWITFLATHFGQLPQYGWKRLRDVYSGLGEETWSWRRVSDNVTAFRNWLDTNSARIGGGFGNHRQYESLNARSAAGTGAVIESYVRWIGPEHSHVAKFSALVRAGGNDPHSIFDVFYNDMNVARFGRLGRFDFLSLVGRLALAPISPGSTYLKGATGPLRGARLLFGGDPFAKIRESILENWLADLDHDLNVGPQVIEDSLCNWQKSPMNFVHFKG